MTLICHEDDKPLPIAEQAFCVTTRDAVMFTAVCAEHVLEIPEEQKSKTSLKGGLDIHFLFSIPNALPGREEFLNVRHMEFGDYRFSIGEDLARLVLPRTCQLYLD